MRLIGRIILFLFFCNTGTSQTIAGKYIGYDFSGMSYQTNKKGKHIKQKVNEVAKTLQLNADSTFSFEYWDPCGLCNSQGGNTKRCSGTWTFNKDTIYLTSKYKEADFIIVKESYMPTKEKDLYKFVNISPSYEDDDDREDWFRNDMGITLLTNNANYRFFYGAIACRKNDTIYFKAKAPVKFSVSAEVDYSAVKCNYEPKDNNANYFEIKIKRTIKNENMWLNRYKLSVVNGELCPLGKYYDNELHIDGKRYYHKQKNLKK